VTRNLRPVLVGAYLAIKAANIDLIDALRHE